MAQFNFTPLQHRYVRPPIEQFKETTNVLGERYEEGLNTSQEVKDLFALMEVSRNDVGQRNEYAGQVSGEISELLDKYEGAYESRNFQRDVESLRTKFAKDPRIAAWQRTKEVENFADKARMDARFQGRNVLFDEGEIKTTVDEDGNFIPGQFSGELQRDWIGKAREVFGQLKDQVYSLKPTAEQIEGVGTAIKTGKVSQVAEEMINDRAGKIADEFIQTDEGTQFIKAQSKALGFEDPSQMSKAQKVLTARQYLIDVNSDQLSNQQLTNYSFPEFLNQQAKQPEFPIVRNARTNISDTTAIPRPDYLNRNVSNSYEAAIRRRAQELNDGKEVKAPRTASLGMSPNNTEFTSDAAKKAYNKAKEEIGSEEKYRANLNKETKQALNKDLNRVVDLKGKESLNQLAKQYGYNDVEEFKNSDEALEAVNNLYNEVGSLISNVEVQVPNDPKVLDKMEEELYRQSDFTEFHYVDENGNIEVMDQDEMRSLIVDSPKSDISVAGVIDPENMLVGEGGKLGERYINGRVIKIKGHGQFITTPPSYEMEGQDPFVDKHINTDYKAINTGFGDYVPSQTTGMNIARVITDEQAQKLSRKYGIRVEKGEYITQELMYNEMADGHYPITSDNLRDIYTLIQNKK